MAAAAKSRRLGPGTIVADKYRLERVLGRGGMGMVIAAKHVQLGTSFALKFLHRSILGTETVPERFLREARATAALRSEHVCRVFDVGSFDGVPFLVMELLEGTDLEKVLRREKRIPPQVACSYIIQACAGVSEAHAAQIVHRDLKPGNLFLVHRDGSSIVKVLDFGIAKAPQEAELGLTGTNAILGSPAYMSLEQLRSSRLVDTRSDIWSLGVILFELIAGRRPFDGAGVADLALRIAMEPNPQLPEDLAAGGLARTQLARMRGSLDEIIARCLARDPADRYQSVAELALALAPFADEPERRIASSLGRAAGPSVVSIEAEPPPPDPQEATTMQSSGVIEAMPRPARRPRGRAGLVALAAAAVCGVSLAVVAMSGGSSPEARATSPGEVVAAIAPPPAVALVPAPAAPAAASAAPAVPAVEPAPAAPAARPAAPAVEAEAPPTISLRFAIEPAGAAVELDGVFVTARQITVRRDDVPHVLRISAPGFAPQAREVRFDDSQKLVIQLQRAAVARPAGASSRPARRPKIESVSPYQ